MNKYYKIPMTERIVSLNKKTLFQTLQENYPELAKREKGRVELTYGGNEPGAMTPQLEETVRKYNAETANVYRQMGVPSHIIGFQKEEGGIVEYITGVPIETSYGSTSVLTGREISQKEATQFLTEESNYYDTVSNLFLKKEEPKSFIKKVKEVLLGR